MSGGVSDLSDDDVGGAGGGVGETAGDDGHFKPKKDRKDVLAALVAGGGGGGGGVGGGGGSSSSSSSASKKDKKKETRYAHLGDDSSGDEPPDAKSPAKSKRSFMTFGSAKKDKKQENSLPAIASNSFAASAAAAAATSSAQTGPLQLFPTSSAHTSSRPGDAVSDVPPSGLSEPGPSKKKDKKTSSKLKLKKLAKHSEYHHHQSDKDEAEDSPVFGVPLELAVERSKCHDGVALPMVIRQCIDHIEDHGLMMEGVYRSSGVKSKVIKLRSAFNTRSKKVDLNCYEPAVVASLLKQFLRELPDPVLTQKLLPTFEAVSANSDPQQRIEGMKKLIAQLPECNRTLVQWIFVHMGHVIERSRYNKMTLQNVSIVLSPTMKISHRVLNCLFENSHILFEGIQLKKYVPPIMVDCGGGGCPKEIDLPDTPGAIQEEIRKQESLLADLHLQISSGSASRKTEEQAWEQQRIVTQLKRKLRLVNKISSEGQADNNEASKPKYEPIEYEEELNFSLQQAPSALNKHSTAAGAEPQPGAELQPDAGDPAAAEVVAAGTPENHSTVVAIDPPVTEKVGFRAEVQDKPALTATQPAEDVNVSKTCPEPREVAKGSEAENKAPDQLERNSVRVKVEAEEGPEMIKSSGSYVEGGLPTLHHPPPTNPSCAPYVTVVTLGDQPTTIKAGAVTVASVAKPALGHHFLAAATSNQPVPGTSAPPAAPANLAQGLIPLLPKPPSRENKTRTAYHHQILQPTQAAPLSSAATTSKPLQHSRPAFPGHSAGTGEVSSSKSKSLPRGLPSDFGQFTASSSSSSSSVYGPKVAASSKNGTNESSGRLLPGQEPQQQQSSDAEKPAAEDVEQLELELMGLQFENEEMEALKSELERRRRCERKEMEQLRKEMATMQTLYQYRTYSVDSSENSSDEASDKDMREVVEGLSKVLADLIRENKELEETRLKLCNKIQEDRAACIQLRVQIRLEQEKLERRRRAAVAAAATQHQAF